MRELKWNADRQTAYQLYIYRILLIGTKKDKVLYKTNLKYLPTLYMHLLIIDHGI